MSIPVPAIAPEPVMKGRFNLWETADGGYRIGYIPDGDSEAKYFDIPGIAVRMAKMGVEGKLGPVKALKEMMMPGG
jgi:hypothetical protein